jgi:cardiolipin synthase
MWRKPNTTRSSQDHATCAACTGWEVLAGSPVPVHPGPFVQVYENLYWGAESSNITADPNPRLQAYIAAARRGAKVRVLLDAFFDNQDLNSPRSNLRTVEYLTSVARAEGLDLQARRRNPTGQGIHNKMVLAQISGQGWVVVGSLNGGEVSAKLNREMALLVGSDEVHNYLADVFWYDWGVAP